MTEIELIGLRARALAKHSSHVAEMRKRVDQDKLKWIQTYEKDYRAVIKDFEFNPGNLVLVRNTAIESALDKKMKARYTGPMIVVKRNKGGSYIVADMTGAVWQHKVARFRVIPYFAREKIDLPGGIMSIIDTDQEALDKLCSQPEEDEPKGRDYLMDDVHMSDSDESDEKFGEEDEFDIAS
jgi:argonaute-like protein implicated in RNA metabolism and viral defense